MAANERRLETSRRKFLKASVLGGAALAGVSRVRRADATEAPPSESSASAPEATASLFAPSEQRALTLLADVVLPGAGTWGAAEYIERLLTSLDYEPPRLYGGMVGSEGEWLPLDRVRLRAWRLRIYGSEAEAHPNEALLGPVRGLRPLMLEGAREAASMLSGSSPGWVWWQLSGDFREAFTELVLEAALGDPIYGGNRDGAAWRAFHFEGAMLGYGTYRPDSHAHRALEGDDAGPDPLNSLTRAALWVMGFFSRRIA